MPKDEALLKKCSEAPDWGLVQGEPLPQCGGRLLPLLLSLLGKKWHSGSPGHWLQAPSAAAGQAYEAGKATLGPGVSP